MANIKRAREKLREAEQELKSLEKRVNKKKTEINKLNLDIADTIRSVKKRQVELAEYSPDFFWSDKIRVTLMKLEQATLNEIVDFIMIQEPTLNRETTYETVKRTVIRMVNKIDVIKLSKYKSKYKLNVKEI